MLRQVEVDLHEGRAFCLHALDTGPALCQALSPCCGRNLRIFPLSFIPSPVLRQPSCSSHADVRIYSQMHRNSVRCSGLRMPRSLLPRRLLMQLLAIASITHAFVLPSARRTLPTPQATTTPATTPTTITADKEAFGARTKRILDGIVADADASGGAGSSISFSTLQAIDRAWDAVKTGRAAGEAPTFVRETDTLLPNAPEFDVVIAGGTLGIFMGTALQLKGFRVCVVERGPLKGRTQEWNISRKEMMELVEEGVLSEEDVEAAIGIDFNPIRVGFVGENDEPYTLWTKDVLHLGVSPSVLLARARARFLAAGGFVRENTPIKGVRIAPNGAAIELEGEGMGDITGRLLIDCMGNQSPISRQSRAGQQPDGICIVVGTMASGFAPENNTYADLLYSNTPTIDKGKSQVHWFWEAFPASSGKEDRTTYLFMYCDAKPERPSILECFEVHMLGFGEGGEFRHD